MPTSDFRQISDISNIIEQVNPSRILDVGVGLGKWGVLARDILEVFKDGCASVNDWHRTIDGIEVYEPYKNLLWDFAYNHIFIGDADKIIENLDRYDLILCCDVIEHFEKDAGIKFLRKLIERGKVVIVTSPRGYSPQDASCGNEYERHRSGWKRSDFCHYPYLYKEFSYTFMVILSENSEHLKSLGLLSELEVMGARKGFQAYWRLAASRLQIKVKAFF